MHALVDLEKNSKKTLDLNLKDLAAIATRIPGCNLSGLVAFVISLWVMMRTV